MFKFFISMLVYGNSKFSIKEHQDIPKTRYVKYKDLDGTLDFWS